MLFVRTGINQPYRIGLDFLSVAFTETNITASLYRVTAYSSCTLMNRSEGKIDSQLIRLSELWGMKSFNGNDIDPHIWKYNDEVSWYCYTPTVTELKALSKSVDDYLECFAEPAFEENEEMEMSM